MSIGLRRFVSHYYFFIIGFTIAAGLLLDTAFFWLVLIEILCLLASIGICSLETKDAGHADGN